jgi:hypothetical protein
MDMEAPGGGSRRTSKARGDSGLHNKRVGCGASGTYAPGPVEEDDEDVLTSYRMWYN